MNRVTMSIVVPSGEAHNAVMQLIQSLLKVLALAGAVSTHSHISTEPVKE